MNIYSAHPDCMNTGFCHSNSSVSSSDSTATILRARDALAIFFNSHYDRLRMKRRVAAYLLVSGIILGASSARRHSRTPTGRRVARLRRRAAKRRSINQRAGANDQKAGANYQRAGARDERPQGRDRRTLTSSFRRCGVFVIVHRLNFPLNTYLRRRNATQNRASAPLAVSAGAGEATWADCWMRSERARAMSAELKFRA